MQKPDQSLQVSVGVRSYLLDGELLLFAEHAHALFRLNPSAAFIWCCCEEGLDRASIISEMVHAFELPVARAEQDLNAILLEWENQGLLGRGDTPKATATGETAAESEVLPAPQIRIDTFPAERRYRMFETVFRLRFSEAALETCAQSAFAHLAVDGDHPYDVILDVLSDTRGYFLLFDDQPVAFCDTQQELAPLLHGQLVADAYERARCLIAFHAAAVSNGEECLVFPALSGSGKSTLTAALMASGFKYCTDELVLLQPQTHRAQTIAAGLGIKPGSWEILRTFHPHISELPIHLRLDGQQVRYLLPDKHQLIGDPTQHHRIRALVFPIYKAGLDTRLDRLTPADALCRLTDAGTDMEGELDATRVTELVDWIAGMDSYELGYSDLEDAIACVRELLP